MMDLELDQLNNMINDSRLSQIINLRVCLFKEEMLRRCARTPRIRSVNNYHAMLHVDTNIELGSR